MGHWRYWKFLARRTSKSCTTTLLWHRGKQRLYYSLLNIGRTYDTAVIALVNYFVPKTKVIAEPHAFRKRAEMSNHCKLMRSDVHLTLVIFRMT